IFATMIILGSFWASIAWSRYWGWDPKETSALVTWLTYAVYIHTRNPRSWAGRPAALLLVVGFGMVLVTYSGSLWFSGLHGYSGLCARAARRHTRRFRAVHGPDDHRRRGPGQALRAHRRPARSQPA